MRPRVVALAIALAAMAAAPVALAGGGGHRATGPDSLAEGQGFRFTFNEPGALDYFCRPHADMTARLIVTDSDPSALGGVVNVTLRGAEFSPERLAIRPGTTVHWINRDPVAHTVTFRDPSKQPAFERFQAFDPSVGEPKEAIPPPAPEVDAKGEPESGHLGVPALPLAGLVAAVLVGAAILRSKSHGVRKG
jgi:plastocyanin